MSKTNITITFEGDEPKVNGRKTSPNYSSNGRSIYITDDYKFILKIDDRGYEHDDLAVYKTIKPEDRKYFVKPLAHGVTENGDSWTVQPYLDLDFDCPDEAHEIIADLVHKYGLFDLDYGGDGVRNWAMHKGRPVIFDYGLG